MYDIVENETDIGSSISELESLGLSMIKLNELNDGHEIENLVQNLKHKFLEDYKSTIIFTD